MKKIIALAVLGLVLALGASACKKKDAPAAQGAAPAMHDYAIEGVVKGFQADGRVIILDHKKIEGLMDAMTMGFELSDPAMGKSLKVGDKVSGVLSHGGDLYKITALKKS